MKFGLLMALFVFGISIAIGHAQAPDIDLSATTDNWSLAVWDGAATMSTVSPADMTASNLLFDGSNPASWQSWFLDPATSSLTTDGPALKIRLRYSRFFAQFPLWQATACINSTSPKWTLVGDR